MDVEAYERVVYLVKHKDIRHDSPESIDINLDREAASSGEGQDLSRPPCPSPWPRSPAAPRCG
jgi:hypothetical protein